MPILFRFHSDARHYALAPIGLQADRTLQFAAKNSCKKPPAFCDEADEGCSSEQTKKLAADAANTQESRKQKTKSMKTLTKLALTIALLTSAMAAQAEWVSGYVRSNGSYVAPHYRSDYGSSAGNSSYGYVYRNPYAASPSVSVG